SYEACAEAAGWLRARLRERPRVALVCGSGLGALAQELRDPQSFEYAEIPHFPRSTVQGHAGRLVVGRLGSAPCAVLQGRFHLYEGYSPAQVVSPVRTLALTGVHTLVLTNAAGSLRPHLGPGHLLVLRDHIDLPGLAGRSPLSLGSVQARFVSRCPQVCSRVLLGVPRCIPGVSQVSPGVPRYAQVYPRCAQVYPRYAQVCQGVPRCVPATPPPSLPPGMSTVSEAAAARHLGLRVLGLSLITNNAPGDDEDDGDDVTSGGAGPGPRPATPAGHEEVLAAAQEGARHLRALLLALAPQLDRPDAP
ncbi:PNPH phosphorylase, partial [Sylvietta virens]|nr:PNPH phosphorylase [Sylvietta virens]